MPGVGKFSFHCSKRSIQSTCDLLVAYTWLSATAIEMRLPAKDGGSMSESIFFTNGGSWS